ncbi:dermatopontin-like [Aplysia californica]|uniref:Dermatopontin-like n=1 Tax=Aplysia californica TaxID=6500 RepID=A0ABM1AEX6_APLCA|nr:dermatopontin-like [Aplysia californica]
MLRLAVLAICVVGYTQAYQNDWDGPHNFQCRHGEYVTSVHSVHDNRREDRRWQLGCGGNEASGSCRWSVYANSWDGPLHHLCPHNMVVAGVSSYHNNRKEDRLFKFRCCALAGKTITNCYLTNWVNYWDAPMNFQVPPGRAITGAHSVHDNRREDRRWKFNVCDIQ